MTASINVPNEVRDVLTRSTIGADRVVLPPEQLDRKLYQKVNKVLAAAGGKWNRKSGAHLFPNDPREALGLAVETGNVEHRKNKLQAFYTPCELADRLAELADPQADDLVLEPSCGEGALLLALIRRQPLLQQSQMAGCDIDASAVEAASATLPGVHLLEQDFIEANPRCEYTLVVMNPPFAKDQDIDHVMHAWKFVRPGGRLVAIMSPGWRTTVRGKRQRFRAFVEGLGGQVEAIEAGAFKESGTNVHTVMVRLDKPA